MDPEQPCGGPTRAPGAALKGQGSSADQAPDAVSPVSLAVGAALGPYRLLSAITRPRIDDPEHAHIWIDDPERAHIWLAESGQGRELALKVYRISALTPLALRRVRQESRIALECAHLPGMVTTEFVGPFGDWWVIAMERLGPTLVEHHRERKVHHGRWRDDDTYTRWIEQISHSLGEMHRAGNAHGDIKAQNIMLDPAQSLAKLADFSRARGAHERDQATEMDQLQLAFVAWRLLAGWKYPADPERRLSRALREALVRAMARRADKRFPDMASFARALRVAARVPDRSAKRIEE